MDSLISSSLPKTTHFEFAAIPETAQKDSSPAMDVSQSPLIRTPPMGINWNAFAGASPTYSGHRFVCDELSCLDTVYSEFFALPEVDFLIKTIPRMDATREFITRLKQENILTPSDLNERFVSICDSCLNLIERFSVSLGEFHRTFKEVTLENGGFLLLSSIPNNTTTKQQFKAFSVHCRESTELLSSEDSISSTQFGELLAQLEKLNRRNECIDHLTYLLRACFSISNIDDGVVVNGLEIMQTLAESISETEEKMSASEFRRRSALAERLEARWKKQ